MEPISGFVGFWYDFIIGDDWMLAAAVVVTLAVIVWLVHAHANPWWLLPLVVVIALGGSVWRAAQAE